MTLRQLTGRALISLSIVTTLVIGVAIDWNVSHWVDPDWTAHARFHLLVYHGTLWLLGLGALWCLWGGARYQPWSLGAAYFAVVIMWLPYFPSALVPGATPIAVPEDVALGLPANLVAGTVHLAVSTCGLLLARFTPRLPIGAAPIDISAKKP
jgi:hypothetical protein